MRLRRSIFLLAGLVATATAHVVSMSTGELRVDGTRAVYELRMPAYELTHLANPDQELLGALRFESATLRGSSCRSEAETLVCTAEYALPSAVDRIAVECRLHSVTVPNHVHLLRAHQGEFTAQAVFDRTFPKAELRFRPPSRQENLAQAAFQGTWRAVAGLIPVLFLAVLALAARGWREAGWLIGAFVAGELLSAWIEPRLSRPLPPRFVEAAMALSVAYLGVEIALLPKAGMRWLVVLALGLLHGFFFARFSEVGEFDRIPFFGGVFAVQVAIAAALTAPFLRLPDRWRGYAAWGACGVGVIWFSVRLLM